MKEHHVYICLFDNGVIKVGRGKHAPDRISIHVSSARNFGIKLSASEYFVSINPWHSEKKLIEWCDRNSLERTNKEWFFGLDFSDCISEIKKIISDEPEKKKSTIETSEYIGQIENLYTDTPRLSDKYIAARNEYVRKHSPSDEFVGLLDFIYRKCEIERRSGASESPEWFDIIDSAGFEDELFFCAADDEHEHHMGFLSALKRCAEVMQ